jgi:hypothetical protein
MAGRSGKTLSVWAEPLRPESWEDFFKLRSEAGVPDEFMADRDDDLPEKRDLF